MGIFSKKERNYILVSIIVLSLVFGFNDKSDLFSASNWLINFLLVIIAVSVSVLLGYVAIKKAAEKIGCETEYEIWSVKRWGFEPEKKFKKKFSLPLGVILPLLITLLSNGLGYFPVVGSHKLTEDKIKRVGKIFSKLTGYERTIILLSSTLTYLVLFFLFLFLSRFGIDFSVFIRVNMWLALFSLLPLPNLDGAEMLFGSLPMYLFALAFVVMSVLLAPVNMILAILLALVLAITIVIAYFVKIS